MGRPKEAQAARLFVSLIISDEDLLQQGLVGLGSLFGETDWMSERFPFHFTDYYAKEMGSPSFATSLPLKT